MLKTNYINILWLLPVLVSASNDWSIPCLDGWCSYDIPSSETSMAGSMTITGPSHAISDITSAAGWEILNCTSDAIAQDIRIVCSGDETSCSHLFENGAEQTIVRLPQNCGSSPFARVVRAEESDNQSLPEHISSRIMRRDGSTPTVHALSFDTNFDQVPSSQHGDVSMFIFGSTIPGLTGNATETPAGSRRRTRMIDKRGLFSLFGDFNKNVSTDLPPINIDQSFNVFNKTLACSANEQAKLSVDVNAKLDAEVTVGAVLSGSIIPPKIKEFGLFADITAELGGGLTIDANIAGEVDTGKIPLFSVGLPGLSIAGIFSLGPTFEIDAEAKATVDLDVNMTVDLAYSVSDLQLFFPPSDGQASTASVAPKDTPEALKLSASPDVSSNATLEAHLIPSLNFGLTFLTTSASVFLDVDTFAALDLGLEASAIVNIDTTGAANASAEVQGCVDVNGGVSINAGAEGSFFGIFDESTQVALFSKDFDFFNKCFTDSASATTSFGSTSTSAASLSSSASAFVSSYHSSSAAQSSASEPASVEVSESSPASTTMLASSASALGSLSTVVSVKSAQSSLMVSASKSEASVSIVSSSDVSPSTSSSSMASATPSGMLMNRTRRARHRRSNAPVGLVKRSFECLSSDLAAAASLVDQTLSSSSFKLL